MINNSSQSCINADWIDIPPEKNRDPKVKKVSIGTQPVCFKSIGSLFWKSEVPILNVWGPPLKLWTVLSTNLTSVSLISLFPMSNWPLSRSPLLSSGVRNLYHCKLDTWQLVNSSTFKLVNFNLVSYSLRILELASLLLRLLFLFVAIVDSLDFPAVTFCVCLWITHVRIGTWVHSVILWLLVELRLFVCLLHLQAGLGDRSDWDVGQFCDKCYVSSLICASCFPLHRKCTDDIDWLLCRKCHRYCM